MLHRKYFFEYVEFFFISRIFPVPRCAKSFMDFIQNYEMFLNPSGNGVEGRPETTTRVNVETSPGVINFIENVISSIFEPAGKFACFKSTCHSFVVHLVTVY